MERWSRGRVTGPDAVTNATAARDFACLRSASSRAVERKLIETNPLMGMRRRSAASRKVVRFLSPDEEAMVRAALAARSSPQGTARTSPRSQPPVALCTPYRAIAGDSPVRLAVHPFARLLHTTSGKRKTSRVSKVSGPFAALHVVTA